MSSDKNKHGVSEEGVNIVEKINKKTGSPSEYS